MARSRKNNSRRLFITVLGITVAGYAVYTVSHRGKSAPPAAVVVLNQNVNEPELRVVESGSQRNVESMTDLRAADPTTKPVAIELEPTTRPAVQMAAFGSPIAAPSAAQALSDARIKLTAGDILGARAVANDALRSGSLSHDELSNLKSFIADINTTVISGRRIFADDPFGGSHTVKPGESMAKIAAQYSTTWQMLCRINQMSDPKKLRAAQTIKIVKGPFHAVVSKSEFKMDLYLGNAGESGSMYVMTLPVGLGKDDSTPTGTWQVEQHKKIQNPTYFSPRGEGVIAADDPKNPLGEYWIGLVGTGGHALGKTSYGIHGTIEPDSIGKMASLGCIRMRNDDVAIVFDMMVEGKSTVVVKE